MSALPKFHDEDLARARAAGELPAPMPQPLPVELAPVEPLPIEALPDAQSRVLLPTDKEPDEG